MSKEFLANQSNLWKREGSLLNIIYYALLVLTFFYSTTVYCYSEPIRVGIFQNKPIVYYEDEPKGLYVDILNEIADREKWELKYVKCELKECLNLLNKQQIDLMTSLGVTPKRSQTMVFSKEPVWTFWGTIYTHRNDIYGLFDLKGKKIGSRGKNKISSDLKDVLSRLKIKAEFIDFTNYEDAFQAVSQNQIDAVAVNNTYALTIHKNNQKLFRTPIVFRPFTAYFAVSKSGKHISKLNIIDTYLKQMKNDRLSVYHKFEEQITGITGHSYISKKIILWILISISTVLILLGIRYHVKTLTLNKKLKLRTDEIKQLNDTLNERVKVEVEKNRHQEQIISQQKKLADMGEMLSAIAHQWRQPLNNIYITSQMLQAIDGGIDYGVTKEELYQQQKELIEYMSKTIDDFKDYFSDRKEKQYFSIINEINETIKLVNAQLTAFSIDTSIDYDRTLDTKEFNYLGYASGFRQVLMNVLNNAKDAIVEWRDHHPKSNTPPKIDIQIVKNNEHYEVIIENTGNPISKENMPRIFNPYFTTKDEGKGTGIGLYMSQMIIKNDMKGKITAQNTNNGVAFHIKLPEVTNGR